MQAGMGSFHPLFCNNWTTHAFHCCCSPTSDIGCIIRFARKDGGNEQNPPTFTLSPGLTRQNVTLRRAAIKEEPMMLSTISAGLASTSASNCEAEHTAVTLQKRSTFFNLSFYTKQSCNLHRATEGAAREAGNEINAVSRRWVLLHQHGHYRCRSKSDLSNGN